MEDSSSEHEDENDVDEDDVDEVIDLTNEDDDESSKEDVSSHDDARWVANICFSLT